MSREVIEMLVEALETFTKGFTGVEEQPRTFACNHALHTTCMSCEGLVKRWRDLHTADKALTAARALLDAPEQGAVGNWQGAEEWERLAYESPTV